jgi:hypothetical protein
LLVAFGDAFSGGVRPLGRITFPTFTMDDVCTRLTTCREGTLEVSVWKSTSYDVEGKYCSTEFDFELSDRSGVSPIRINLHDLPDLPKVIGLALGQVQKEVDKDHAFNLGALFTALRDAASSSQ